MTSTATSSDDKFVNPLDRKRLNREQGIKDENLILPWRDETLKLIKEEAPLANLVRSTDEMFRIFQEDIKKIPLKVFRDELLPMLMSMDPKTCQLGREYFIKIAHGLYHPLDVIDEETGELVVRVPGATSHARSLTFTEFDGTLNGRLEEAYQIDRQSARPSKVRSVLEKFIDDAGSLFDIKYLIAWDYVITMFGYPSYFTEEERNSLGLPEIKLYKDSKPQHVDFKMTPKGESARGVYKGETEVTPPKTEQTKIEDNSTVIYDDNETEWVDD